MIFSQKILKNYIVRCDFWSCRHFVDRLTFIISDNAKIINVLTNILDENMIKLLYRGKINGKNVVVKA